MGTSFDLSRRGGREHYCPIASTRAQRVISGGRPSADRAARAGRRLSPAARALSGSNTMPPPPSARVRSRQVLHLRDPQHRRRGQEGRGGRPEGALSEHRRPDSVRVQDAAAPDRRRRARDARRPQRLRAIGRHRAGARGGRAPNGRARHARLARSRRHHLGHVGRHRARARRARRRRRRSAACRRRPIRSTPRCSRRSARGRCTTAPIRHNGWLPDLDDIKRPDHAGDARARRHRSEQSDRRRLSGSDAARAASTSPITPALPILADEVYGDLAFDGPTPLLGSLAPDAPIISFSSLSKAYLAPGLARRLARGRPLASGSTTRWRRSRSWPTDGSAARRRCSTRSNAALTGDRSHQASSRASCASART